MAHQPTSSFVVLPLLRRPEFFWYLRVSLLISIGGWTVCIRLAFIQWFLQFLSEFWTSWISYSYLLNWHSDDLCGLLQWYGSWFSCLSSQKPEASTNVSATLSGLWSPMWMVSFLFLAEGPSNGSFPKCTCVCLMISLNLLRSLVLSIWQSNCMCPERVLCLRMSAPL